MEGEEAGVAVHRFELEKHVDLDEEDVESVDQDEPAGSATPVKYHVYDLSLRGRLRRALLRNSKARLRSAYFDFFLKLLICITYVARMLADDSRLYFCDGEPFQPVCPKDGNSTEKPPSYTFTDISWYVVLWIRRPLWVYIIQVLFSSLSIIKTIVTLIVSTRAHRIQLAMSISFWVEVLVSLPYLITLTYPSVLMQLFIPSFLNCWLAKKALERIFNDLHMTRQKFQTISVTMYQQIILLVASLMCLIFTTVCGIEHIQRASYSGKLTTWESFYFTIVTFSTVGYGDISPDIWPSQLFMIIMICVAFAFIPRQLEGIASTYLERQKAGGEYSRRSASRNKHVVVCSSVLTVDVVMDFLSEFYAHPKLEEHVVILLCPRELDNGMQVILKDPKWAHRVIYMRGSPGKDTDLKRCRIHEAEACFLLAHRASADKAQADQHTILRSWAVKDFAPACKQYIQLFHAKNKMHVKFAEHIVCEDEFKYALLANNCLYPGLSTLVALLVHTSAEVVNALSEKLLSDRWQQVYGRHSGNEIYHIQLQKSIFFQQFKGRPFPEASAEAHRLFGVSLVAVLDPDDAEPRLMLNPGPKYTLKERDYCFYIAIQREEYARIDRNLIDKALSARKEDGQPSVDYNKNIEQIAAAVQKYHNTLTEGEEEDEEESVFNTITSFMGKTIMKDARGDIMDHFKKNASVGRFQVERSETQPASLSQMGESAPQPNGHVPGNEIMEAVDHVHMTGKGRVLNMYQDMGQEKFTTGPPPVTIFIGSRRTVCHIMAEPRSLCCLEWGVHCQHCRYKNASDNRWKEQLVLLAAQRACSGVYNFIIPLRSNFINKEALQPIILLLEEQPDQVFLETIAQFPLVYWMLGTITKLDDLLRAGINKSSHIVVVNRDKGLESEEETLSDSDTIVAVQTIFKLFPNANVITELSQASNMRFMHFRGHDKYCQKISRLERKLKETMPSTLSHIFRLPFAAGHVFSASMLDTLLYQTFVKGYLITFVRLLLGIDAEHGSGHLSSIKVRKVTVQTYPSYGELYRALCEVTGEIPIAIYRTERLSPGDAATCSQQSEPLEPLKRVTTMANHSFNTGVTDNSDLADFIRSRLCSLDIDSTDYRGEVKHSDMISFVICNPTPGRRLRVGDIVYVIQPSTMTAVPTKPNWRQRSHSYSGPSRGAGRRRGSWPFNRGDAATAAAPASTADDSMLDPDMHPAPCHYTIGGEFLRAPRERGPALADLFAGLGEKEGGLQPIKSESGEIVVPVPQTAVQQQQRPPPKSQSKPTMNLFKGMERGKRASRDEDSLGSGSFSPTANNDSRLFDKDSLWGDVEKPSGLPLRTSTSSDVFVPSSSRKLSSGPTSPAGTNGSRLGTRRDSVPDRMGNGAPGGRVDTLASVSGGVGTPQLQSTPTARPGGRRSASLTSPPVFEDSKSPLRKATSKGRFTVVVTDTPVDVQGDADTKEGGGRPKEPPSPGSSEDGDGVPLLPGAGAAGEGEVTTAGQGEQLPPPTNPPC